MSPKTRFIDRTEGVTEDEWRDLPVTFGVPDMSRLARVPERYVQDHAADFGGRKVAGRWLFSKNGAAELLGL